MVCEVPRQRQLHVTRRGSFFEDPFFSDAWDDYSHAVRRIVDRFNRGWVNPANRIRDAQYHSMYRTLRSARLNYSTHSARFKEEGNVYKLVMDVREFVGGDITVRTAGGTVSVRGKMEVGPDDGASRDDDDDKSTISGRSSSGKTLHRRFTLPADADCEKVESSLSRDAVLTVTIPKRTDVHYIPVNIEGEANKENEQNGSICAVEDARQPGVKRPSDSPVESKSKKSQEDASINRRRRRRRTRREDEEGDENKDGNRDEKKEERKSRRRTKDNKEYYTKFGDSFRESKKLDDETEGKRRRKDDDGGRKPSSDRRSRRRESTKYEDVHEINIPVRIGKGDDKPEKIFRPSSLHEPRVHNIEIEREVEPTLELGKESQHAIERKEQQPSWTLRKSDRSRSSDVKKPEMENGVFSPRRRSFPDRKLEDLSRGLPQFNLKPVQEVKFASAKQEMNDHDMSNAQQNGKGSNDNVTKTPTEFLRRRINVGNDEGTVDKNKSPRPVSMPTIKFDFNEDEIPKVERILKIEPSQDDEESEDESEQDDSENERNKENDNRKQNQRENDINSEEKTKGIKENDIKLRRSMTEGLDSTKDKLEAPKLNLFQRPTSPVSPGSRLVKVEQDPTMMEDGMFKDCWSDFSNTLQDVLSRLQELSSELGQKSKLLATTPSAEQSPPIGQEETTSVPFTFVQEDSTLDKGSNRLQNKAPHIDNGRVGGVGGCVGVALEGTIGGAKENGNAHQKPWESGQGQYSEASASIADRVAVNDENGEEREIGDKGERGDKGEKSDKGEERNAINGPIERVKFSRPDSLALRSVISPLKPTSNAGQSQEARPNSLNLTDSAPGSLLASLRKNSPVEALQKEFYRRSLVEEPSPDHALNYSVPVVPEGGAEDVEPLNSLSEKGSSVPGVLVGGPKKDEEARTLKPLSPSSSQSASHSETSDTAFSDVLGAGTETESDRWRDAYKARGTAASDSRDSSGSRKSVDKDYFTSRRFSSLNDLDEAEVPTLSTKSEKNTSPIRKNYSFAPNIDASPESNVTDEEDSIDEAEVVHGHFTFPVSSKNLPEEVAKPKYSRNREQSDLNSKSVGDVTHTSDVASDVTRDETLANLGRPEIVPSDDVMVCERPLASRAQTVMPTQSATEESKRFSRANRPRDLLLQESSDGVRVGAASQSAMGGALSRGRKTPLETSSPGPQTRKGKESPPLPPYVRAKPEPKRTSGFGHINNDSVRRMRDVWGTKQDPKKVSNPPRPQKVPSSPSTPTRKTNESHPISASPADKNRSTTFRRSSPSPSRGISSPSQRKQPSNRFFREESPLRANENQKPSTPPFSNSTVSSSSKRGSLASQGRASPISTSKGTSSPSYRKLPTERFFRESSPLSSKTSSKPSTPSYYSCSSRRGSQGSQGRASPAPSSKSSSKPTSPPYYDSRRSSLASQGRNSPAPQSPSCRRCCRGARESPSPSPSVERKIRDLGRRASDDKARTSNTRRAPSGGRDSPCRTPTGGKDTPTRRSPPVVEPPRASKVHQKIFRRLRDANLRPESEAICFKEEEDKYTMILDVEEFVPGEIDVLQDDMVLTVKGRVETKSARGHVSVKTFHRTFDIPKNSKEEDIDSALSKDGILTIYVPKKRERVIKIELVD